MTQPEALVKAGPHSDARLCRPVDTRCDLFRTREIEKRSGGKHGSHPPFHARDLRFDAVERRWTPLSDNLRVNLVQPPP
jgi:hypothetical protein